MPRIQEVHGRDRVCPELCIQPQQMAARQFWLHRNVVSAGKHFYVTSWFVSHVRTLSKGWNIKSYMHSCGIHKSRQRTTSHIRGYLFQPKTLGEERVHYDIQSEFSVTGFWPLSICLFRVTNSSALHCTFNVDPLYLQHENSGDAVDYMVNMWYLWFFTFRTMDVRFELSMFKGLTLTALNFSLPIHIMPHFMF